MSAPRRTDAVERGLDQIRAHMRAIAQDIATEDDPDRKRDAADIEAALEYIAAKCAPRASGPRFYGMNGAKGRAKTLRSSRLDQVRRAKAAGVDVTDRVAFKAWRDAEFAATMAELAAIPRRKP